MAGARKPARSATPRPEGTSEASDPCCVYGVHGPDDFLRRQAIDDIADEIFAGQPPPMARLDYDGPGAELAEVLDEVRTLSFLAHRRLVIVHDADPFISKHREALERYLESPSEMGTLVLVCKTLNRQWRLTKAIAKRGRLIECKPPPPWQRDKWVVQRAQQAYAKRMDVPTAQVLVDLVGDDMAALDAELSKLAIYVGDRDAITARDVEALVGLSRPEKVFGMTDAIAQGDAAAALKVWRQTLATDSQAVHRAIGGVAWGVRQMLTAKTQGARGVNPSSSKAAAGFAVEQLHDMLVQLLSADVSSKTGAGSVDSAMERFIIQQCRARAGASRSRPAANPRR